MRRKERECQDPAFLERMLEETEVMTVAFPAEDYPYVLPFNFVRLGDSLYIHCASEGRKLDCLARDPRVGFCLYGSVEIDRAGATTLYDCLCGTGRAEIEEDRDVKRAVLDKLSAKYRSSCPIPTPDSAVAGTTVIGIRIETLSGKRNPPKH